MEFLKKFFNDESNLVGLCGFKDYQTNPYKNLKTNVTFENAYPKELFDADYSRNILLL